MSDFGKAFRAARASGKSVFAFGGKSYNTKLKSDSPAAKAVAAKKVPTPTPRPSNTPAPDVASKTTDKVSAPASTPAAPTVVAKAAPNNAPTVKQRGIPQDQRTPGVASQVAKAVQQSTSDFRDAAQAADKSLGQDASAPNTDKTATASITKPVDNRIQKAVDAATTKIAAKTAPAAPTAKVDPKKVIRGRNGLPMK
jgi:hypothetical protein